MELKAPHHQAGTAMEDARAMPKEGTVGRDHADGLSIAFEKRARRDRIAHREQATPRKASAKTGSAHRAQVVMIESGGRRQSHCKISTLHPRSPNGLILPSKVLGPTTMGASQRQERMSVVVFDVIRSDGDFPCVFQYSVFALITGNDLRQTFFSVDAGAATRGTLCRHEDQGRHVAA